MNIAHHRTVISLQAVQVPFILQGLHIRTTRRGFSPRILARSPAWARRWVVKIKNLKWALMALAGAFAVLTAGGHLVVGDEASANQCANQCYAQENACRRATNDDPKCGAELTKCLQSCRGK